MVKFKYEVNVDEAGAIYWYLNGELHREGGPAILYSNSEKYWYLNGLLHREDGPAVEDSDSGYNSWYLKGMFLTERTHSFRVRGLGK